MAKISPAGVFGFYAGLCLLGWLFFLFCFPETAGLSLEEIQSIFRDPRELENEESKARDEDAAGHQSGTGGCMMGTQGYDIDLTDEEEFLLKLRNTRVPML